MYLHVRLLYEGLGHQATGRLRFEGACEANKMGRSLALVLIDETRSQLEEMQKRTLLTTARRHAWWRRSGAAILARCGFIKRRRGWAWACSF